mmetsp:Transcript_94769/g.141990  ORF Transcript_94769/g.141990 Transcript_94769/m.141990 type:complete len:142 (+) Transcript_94769:98-523(+)
MTISRTTSPFLLRRILSQKTTRPNEQSSTRRMAECEEAHNPVVETHEETKNKKTRRRVHFAVTPNLTIKAQYIEPSYELTNQICNDLWWSSTEREESGMERRFLTMDFRDSEKGEMVEEGFPNFPRRFHGIASIMYTPCFR